MNPGPLPICAYSEATEESVYRSDTWPEEIGPIDDEPRLWTDGECYFCGNKVRTHEVASIQMSNEKLSLCIHCGWWGIRRLVVGGQDSCNITYIRGEAKHYAVEALDVPIASLREYLLKNPNHIAKTDPSRFELLVADCLRAEYAPCEVTHVGGTGDGGVDIKMITSDKDTFMIQVKRREDLSKREGVSVVRSLNGVLFREGVAKGMVVTSAKGFTKAATEELLIKTPTEKPYHVRLLSFPDIVRMLNLVPSSPYQPWSKYSLADKWSTNGGTCSDICLTGRYAH